MARGNTFDFQVFWSISRQLQHLSWNNNIKKQKKNQLKYITITTPKNNLNNKLFFTCSFKSISVSNFEIQTGREKGGGVWYFVFNVCYKMAGKSVTADIQVFFNLIHKIDTLHHKFKWIFKEPYFSCQILKNCGTIYSSSSTNSAVTCCPIL